MAKVRKIRKDKCLKPDDIREVNFSPACIWELELTETSKGKRKSRGGMTAMQLRKINSR
jgi:hypothetical protein